MTLNDINLPASVIADLYKSSLIETGENVSADPVKIPPVKRVDKIQVETGLKYLGENGKNIVLVVNNRDAVHLSDNELQFLTNMLTACKLSLADVAILNIHNQHILYKELLTELNSRIILLFDIEPGDFGLPMNFPPFQIQPFGGCSFLYAPSLKELEDDKVLKSKLWVSLRRLFNI